MEGFLDMQSTDLCGFGSDAGENKSAKSCIDERCFVEAV